MSKVRIVKAVQVSEERPVQWDAWDEQGNYWLLTYSFGQGTAEQLPGPDPWQWPYDREPAAVFSYGDPLAGTLDLAKFCELAGLELRLRKPPLIRRLLEAAASIGAFW